MADWTMNDGVRTVGYTRGDSCGNHHAYTYTYTSRTREPVVPWPPNAKCATMVSVRVAVRAAKHTR